MFYIGLYRENMKKSSCLKPQGLDIWYVASPIGPLPICSNCTIEAKNCHAPGVKFFTCAYIGKP